MENELAQPTDHVFPKPADDPAETPHIAPYCEKEVLLARLVAIPLAMASLALVLITGSFLWLLLLAPPAIAAAVLAFYCRHPRRTIPEICGALLSPADGTVAEIERLHEEEFLRAEALKIAVHSSLLDVHVTRFPCGGRVLFVEHRSAVTSPAGPGHAKLVGMERLDPGGPAGDRILLKQIGGRRAEKIACRVRRGDRVWCGGLLGMIKFGSRTELYVPLRREAPFDLYVREGTRVRAGVTVIGTWKNGNGSEPSHNR